MSISYNTIIWIAEDCLSYHVYINLFRYIGLRGSYEGIQLTIIWAYSTPNTGLLLRSLFCVMIIYICVSIYKDRQIDR